MIDIHEDILMVFAEAQSLARIHEYRARWLAHHREQRNDARRITPAVVHCMCPECGTVFSYVTDAGRPQVYCSHECAMAEARREYCHRVWESRAVRELFA